MKLHPWLVWAGLSMTATAWANDAKVAAANYLATGQSVIEHIQQDVVDLAQVELGINDMLEQTKAVLPAYAAQHQQCAQQLARLLELFPELEVWTAREIRQNIERGTVLPPAEGCYPGRDIVAHPAIVRRVLRDQGVRPELKPRLVAELDEAIEHMSAIAQDL